MGDGGGHQKKQIMFCKSETSKRRSGALKTESSFGEGVCKFEQAGGGGELPREATHRQAATIKSSPKWVKKKQHLGLILPSCCILVLRFVTLRAARANSPSTHPSYPTHGILRCSSCGVAPARTLRLLLTTCCQSGNQLTVVTARTLVDRSFPMDSLSGGVRRGL